MAKNRKIASTKPAKVVLASEVDVVVEKKGMGWEGGVVIITFLVLLAAVLCVDWDLGHKFNEGMFFKH